MRLPLNESESAGVLWRVVGHGVQSVPPGRPYWWVNRGREPDASVVVKSVRAGALVVRSPGEDRVVRAGQIVTFVYGDDLSYGWPATPVPEEGNGEAGVGTQTLEMAWVVLRGAGLAEHAALLRRGGGLVLDSASGLERRLDRLRVLADPPSGLTGQADMAAAVHELVGALLRRAEDRLDEDASPVQRGVRLVLRHPHRPLSLSQYADRVGCSREHLSRVFTQQVGQPPHAYLTHRRLERALALLRQTDLPLRDVARQAGFVSVKTMGRQVRERTGRSASGARGAGGAGGGGGG